jgi:hypothetical protein
MTEPQPMTTAHDADYFRRRAAESRAAACAKGREEMAAIDGDLALAYAALARRRAAAAGEELDPRAIPLPETA